MKNKQKYCPSTKLELRKLILDPEIELYEIDTSRITDMSHLFEPTLRGGEQARMFYDGIDEWDVSNVTDMSYMFCYANGFNEDISHWKVSKVTNMRGMFQFASSFNQDISTWDVSSVVNMSSMFYDAISFNQNLDRWNISKVKTTRFMFMYARYFDKKPTWDMSNVDDQVGMYYGSPIVYVDPDAVTSVDPTLEAIAESESIAMELDAVTANDRIEKFVRNIESKSSTLADRIESKFSGVKNDKNTGDESVGNKAEAAGNKNEVNSPDEFLVQSAVDKRKINLKKKKQNNVLDDLERLQQLKESGMVTDEEFALLKKKLFSDF